jgi:hypothetical protein
MASGAIFAGFPSFVVDGDDVSGSWKKWKQRFKIAVEMEMVKWGKEKVEEENVDPLTPRVKLLALLQSVGSEGMEVLTAGGFDIDIAEWTYARSLEVLVNHHEGEESLFVRTQKFVTVRQVLDERSREYLMRVEKLSREVGFIASDVTEVRAAQEEIRSRFAMTLAINGLRDSGMRRTLMQTPDLTWARLTNSLRNSEQAPKDDIVLCRRD